MNQPVLKYSSSSVLFGLFGAFEIREDARKHGFEWDARGFWKTSSPFKALQFADFAHGSARMMLKPYLDSIKESQATTSIHEIPAPEGLQYLPFQKAGIIYASRRGNCLIGDEPGLGKTIQAIGLANYLGLKTLLVICPAGLRLNWAREIEKWHLFNPGVEVILNGKNQIRPGRSVVISYDLACRIPFFTTYDLVIADELHYCKSPTAERTKRVLGSRGRPGLFDLGRRKIGLTGTPVPNRVNEIYPVVRKLAPQVIDNMNYRAFLNYYAVTVCGLYGEQVVGSKNEDELYRRMRAGFMVRRLKKDVLKDLPAKQYKMVVFNDSGFAKVLKREKQFDAKEILRAGVPVGSALPEIRREMGIAKAPLVSQYVEDMLEDGVGKVIVYAHHRDVVSILQKNLRMYSPVVVSGATSAQARQAAVDSFQNDPFTRVFIGNLVAAGVGITLTAASDIVFAEASWVPGENEQAEDRCHRVGQEDSVLVHYLVVEGSLDAAILGAAAKKRSSISRVLDGVTL